MQKQSLIADCGFWEGVEWLWIFQWRKEFFEWERQSFYDLKYFLLQVVLSADAHDQVVWRHNPSGLFSVRSFVDQYLKIQDSQMQAHNNFKNIWKGIKPPRMELLVWFVIIGRLNTKDRFARFNILQEDNSRCVLCKAEDETIDHLFVTCRFTWEIWCCCLQWGGHAWVMPNTLKGLFEVWTDMCGLGMRKNRWWSLLFVVIWSVWGMRNSIIFENKSGSRESLIAGIKAYWDSWLVFVNRSNAAALESRRHGPEIDSTRIV